MARQNAFLAKQKAHMDRMCDIQRAFTICQCKDMMLIAANDCGWGAERLHQLEEAYDKVFDDYANLAINDGRDDPDIEYTKAKVDRRMKQAMGRWFRPWLERYAAFYQNGGR